MNDTITINRFDLRAALLEWERSSRVGEAVRTDAERRAVPAEEVAAENTVLLWRLLTTQR